MKVKFQRLCTIDLAKILVIITLFSLLLPSVFAQEVQNNQDNLKEKIEVCNKNIKDNPANAAPYMERGKIYLENKEFDLALTDFEQVIKLEPENVDVYLARGLSYTGSKKYVEAIADFTTVLEKNPQKIEAYFRRGVCYYYSNEYELAIGDQEHVIVMQPQHPGAYLVKAACYEKMEHDNEAIAAYQSLLKNVPADIENKAAIDIAQKRLEKLTKK